MKKLFTVNNEPFYSELLDNGLTVILAPKNNHKKMTISYTVLAGGYKNKAMLNGKNIEFKSGIAHFLEHIIFKLEDGSDALFKMHKNGADANAYTSGSITKYHFTLMKDIVDYKQNLNILLDFVNKPYFSDKIIDHEKGIITQEYKRSFSKPWTIIWDRVFDNLFYSHPCKLDVLGSLKDIKAMTKADIESFYKTFYHPANSILTISGGFDHQEAIDIINKYYKGVEHDNFILGKTLIDEPVSVKRKYGRITLDITNRKMTLVYKVKADVFTPQLINYYDIFLDALFGATSDFKELNIKKQYLLSYDYGIYPVDGFILFIFTGDTNNHQLAIKKIKEIMASKSVSRDVYDRMMKVNRAGLIMATDQSWRIDHIVTQQLETFGVLDNPNDILNSMSYEEFQTTISDLDLSNSTYFIAKPKNKV